MRGRKLTIMRGASILVGFVVATSACDLTTERPQSTTAAQHDDEGGKNDDGSDGQGQDDDHQGEPTMIVGTVYAFVELNPIANARVCLLGPEDMPCVASGGDGRYAFPQMPSGIQIGVTAEANGFVSAATWGLAEEGEMGVDVGMLSAAARDAFGMAIGQQFDSSKSHIAIGASDGMTPISGVSWTIDPASGVQAYVGDDGLPHADMQATSAAGIGGWINVDGQTVELAVKRDGATCTASASALPGKADNSTRLPLLPGHFNGVIGGFVCM
jgi:hypothetical protein